MDLTQKIRMKIDSGQINKSELSDLLGITRATVYVRLERGNWKKSEIAVLSKL